MSFLKHHPPCDLRQDFPLSWSLPTQVGWPASKSQGSTPIPAQLRTVITEHHASLLSLLFLGPKSGPRACVASALLAELSLQL